MGQRRFGARGESAVNHGPIPIPAFPLKGKEAIVTRHGAICHVTAVHVTLTAFRHAMASPVTRHGPSVTRHGPSRHASRFHPSHGPSRSSAKIPRDFHLTPDST